MPRPPPEARRGSSAEGMRSRHHAGVSDPGYSPDELDFLKAVQKWKDDNHNPFPTWSTVLAVLISRGWRRVAEPTALPGRYGEGAK